MAKRWFYPLALAALLATSGPLTAQAAAPATANASTESSEAVVKKIDPAAGKVSLAHGPLKNLGMPAMTMVFKVKDPALLGRLKVGDRIRFVAELSGNDYLATQIEKVR